MAEIRTVKDLIEVEHDVDFDVYDDYTEELGIAYCGTKLTKEGYKHFAEALELPVSNIYRNVDGEIETVIIGVDAGTDRECEHRLKIAIELFYGMAGYCPCEDWDKWFKED